jgi:hypothetical protein
MNRHSNNNGIGKRSPEERNKQGSKVVSLKRGMLVHVRPWRHQRNMRLITEPCLRAHNRSSPLSKYFYSIFPQIIHLFSLSPLFCVSLRTDELWSSKKDQLRLAINTNLLGYGRVRAQAKNRIRILMYNGKSSIGQIYLRTLLSALTRAYYARKYDSLSRVIILIRQKVMATWVINTASRLTQHLAR